MRTTLRTLFAHVLLAALLVAPILGGAACRKAPTPEQEVVAAIDEAVALLEARRYRDFLDRWPAPEDKKALLEGATLDKRAEQFAGGPATKLVQGLRSIRDRAPTWNEARTEAVWVVDDSVGYELKLARIDGRWYIRNN